MKRQSRGRVVCFAGPASQRLAGACLPACLRQQGAAGKRAGGAAAATAHVAEHLLPCFLNAEQTGAYPALPCAPPLSPPSLPPCPVPTGGACEQTACEQRAGEQAAGEQRAGEQGRVSSGMCRLFCQHESPAFAATWCTGSESHCPRPTCSCASSADCLDARSASMAAVFTLTSCSGFGLERHKGRAHQLRQRAGL